jgi:hypothetical protein
MNTARTEPGFFARHAGLRRTMALVLAAFVPSACMTWRPVMGRESYVTAKRPEHVRAVLAGGATVDLYSPTAAAGRLIGYQRKGVEASRVSIPTRDVARVEVREVDGKRTTGVVITATIAVGIVALAVAGMSSIHYGFSLPFGRL